MSTQTTTATQPVSAWAPFGIGAFALLWSATLVSNIGTWMHDVGAGWLMTTLNPSPAVVTLVQAATTLPVFLFALFAGTLADRIDKRRLLIVVNLALVVIIAGLAVLVASDRMTPGLLVGITFLIGTGAAFMAPAWQAVVPELVPRTHLQPAIALNSMGINISRAIGPALAGFLITAVGLAAPFAVNAASGVLVIRVHGAAINHGRQLVLGLQTLGGGVCPRQDGRQRLVERLVKGNGDAGGARIVGAPSNLVINELTPDHRKRAQAHGVGNVLFRLLVKVCVAHLTLVGAKVHPGRQLGRRLAASAWCLQILVDDPSRSGSWRDGTRLWSDGQRDDESDREQTGHQHDQERIKRSE